MATKAQRAAKPGTASTVEESGDTRDKILDVAERLFAAKGIESVTLRDITSAAGVNLAAVHYHLGSREELLRAIFVRRMTPLLEERVRRLERAPQGGDLHDRIEHIVRAFVEPTMDYDCSGDDYLVHRLITRLTAFEERNPVDVFHFILSETHAKFLDAFAEALPALSRERLGYRFEFMLGLVTHATALRAKLVASSRDIHGIRSAEQLAPELVATIVAIFLAA